MKLSWENTKSALGDFGGEAITLRVPKTGLAFFDALRLYGAIDLYIGLREDVIINDWGFEWRVTARTRPRRLANKPARVFNLVRDTLKPKPPRGLTAEAFSTALRDWLALRPGDQRIYESLHQANSAFSDLDAAIQSGIRGTAAASYDTLQSGQSSAKECIAQIRLVDGLLARVGAERTDMIGGIVFLPLFEGRIDLSKVISPLRAWAGVPNVLCAQALMLLALRASLFAEGYERTLTAVVYNKRVTQGDFAFSGVIGIASTAIGKIQTDGLVSHIYSVFRRLVGEGWKRQGRSYQSTAFTQDALATAYWLLQPVPKHLSAMIASQERLHRERIPHVFGPPDSVTEIFEMTYSDGIDYEAVRKFAKAISSAIYHARMRGSTDPQKSWYDEVTMLRSAPGSKQFFERALILLEQGHRKVSTVGTAFRDEAYDPAALLAATRGDFERFRNLFRMYLVQESTPRTGVAASPADAESADETVTQSSSEATE